MSLSLIQRISSQLCTAALVLGIAATGAAQPANQVGPALPEPGPGTQLAPARHRVAVLAEDALESFDIVTAQPDRIVMDWNTRTGCQYRIEATPDSEVAVLAGEGGRCDFEAWIADNVDWIEATQIVDIWDDPAWLSLFQALAGGGGDGGGDPTEPPPGYTPPENPVEIQDADGSCLGALEDMGLSALGCAGAVAVTIGGAPTGVLLVGGIAATVSACGLYYKAKYHAVQECFGRDEALFGYTPDDLLYLGDVTEFDAFERYCDMEDFAMSFVEIQDLAAAAYEHDDPRCLLDLYVDSMQTVDLCQAR